MSETTPVAPTAEIPKPQLIQGAPLVGLTDAERAALPKLAPVPIAQMTYTTGVSEAQMSMHLTEEDVRYDLGHQLPTPGVAPAKATPLATLAADVFTVPMTANQIKAMTNYANSIGITAFMASPVLAAINAGNPSLAMTLLMADIRVHDRVSFNSYKARLAERQLFLS